MFLVRVVVLRYFLRPTPPPHELLLLPVREELPPFNLGFFFFFNLSIYLSPPFLFLDCSIIGRVFCSTLADAIPGFGCQGALWSKLPFNVSPTNLSAPLRMPSSLAPPFYFLLITQLQGRGKSQRHDGPGRMCWGPQVGIKMPRLSPLEGRSLPMRLIRLCSQLHSPLFPFFLMAFEESRLRTADTVSPKSYLRNFLASDGDSIPKGPPVRYYAFRMFST